MSILRKFKFPPQKTLLLLSALFFVKKKKKVDQNSKAFNNIFNSIIILQIRRLSYADSKNILRLKYYFFIKIQ